jgi:hypothetical protein
MFKNVLISLMKMGVKMWFHGKNGPFNMQFIWNNIVVQ